MSSLLAIATLCVATPCLLWVSMLFVCARNVPCIPLCYPHHTANPPLIIGELSRVNHEWHQPLPTFAVAWHALPDASEWVKDIILNGYKDVFNSSAKHSAAEVRVFQSASKAIPVLS